MSDPIQDWQEYQRSTVESTNKTSVVEKYNNQTKQELSPVEKDKAKVANVVQKATGMKYLGAVLNPALNTVAYLDKKYLEPVREFGSAALLYPVVSNWRVARDLSQKVSIGQAAATALGQEVSGLIPKSVERSLPKFLRSDFDIQNDEERVLAFEWDKAGRYISGGLDFAAAVAGSKGTAAVAKKGAVLVAGKRVLKTDKDIQLFRTEVEQATNAIKSGAELKTSTAKLMQEAIQETSPAKLMTNPLVASSNNQYRAATLLSRINNADDMRNYLFAERGDAAALESLFKSAPSIADSLNNFGIKTAQPLRSFDELWEMPDKVQAGRLSSILQDLKQKDTALANALDSLAADTQGRGLPNQYRPGRSSFLDKGQYFRKTFQFRVGDKNWKPFGEDATGNGWRTKVYQSSPFERAVVVMEYASRTRPLGHINVSNPRMGESARDLMTDLNRVGALRTPAGEALKARAVKQFIEASNDTQRARVLAQVEEDVLMHLKDHYNIGRLRGVTEGKEIDQIKDWLKKTWLRRETASEFLAKNNGIIEGPNKELIVTNVTIRSNEAQIVPMLDFARAENVIIKAMYKEGKAGNIAGGPTVSTTTRGLVGARTGAIMVSHAFDLLNMAFSNAHLLRLAFIPKNSMLEPWVRASMETETLFGYRNILPGASNVIYNSTRRAQSAITRASTKKRRMALERQLQQHITDLDSNLSAKGKLTDQIKSTQDALAQTQKTLISEQKRLRRLEAKGVADEDLAVVHKRIAELTDEIKETQFSIDTASLQLAKHEDAINVSNTGIRTTREAREELISIYDKQASLRDRRYILEEPMVIRVDGKEYTLPGIADPNVKGANAFMTEAGSHADFNATARLPQMAQKYASESERWVRISKTKDSDQYYNALAHWANRTLHDDELGRMILEGVPFDKQRNWLLSAKGSDYRKRIEDRFPTGRDVDVEDLDYWLSTTNTKIREMFPDQSLNDLILRRPVTPSEIKARIGGHPNLPEFIDGPNTSLTSLNPVERVYAHFMNAAVTQPWKYISLVEDRLVRNHLYGQYISEELSSMAAFAKRQGIEVTEEMIAGPMRQVAYRKALSRLENTLYSSHRLTNAGYAMRYLMAFPTAFFNSQIVAARLLVKNPYNAYWYSRVREAGDSSPFAYEDNDGNTYDRLDDVPKGTSVSIRFPIFDKYLGFAPEDVKGMYTDPRGGGLKLNPKQLEFMVNDPSISFFASVPLSMLIKKGFGPLKGEDVKNKLRSILGDEVYESSVMYGGYVTQGQTTGETLANTIMPGWLRTLTNAVTGRTGAADDARFASDAGSLYRYQYSLWQDGKGEKPNFIDSVKTQANFYWLRAIVQFASPVSVTFDPVTRASAQYYGRLLDKHNGDQQAAEREFVEKFDVSGLALVGSTNKNIAGLSPIDDDIKLLRNNSNLLASIGSIDPRLAGMLSKSGVADVSDEYSAEIMEIYRNLNYPGTNEKIVQRKTEAEIVAQPETRIGWYLWTKAKEANKARMEEVGITSTQSNDYRTSGMRESMKRTEFMLKKAYPKWYEERQQGSKDWWSNSYEALVLIANDSKFRSQQKTSMWDEVAFWLDQTARFKNVYENAANRGLDRSGIMNAYGYWHEKYAQQASPEFQLFADRWLENMPELRDWLGN